MLNARTNEVNIDGILSEIDLEHSTYTNKKTGETSPCIRGQFKVRVNQEVNGEQRELEIPIQVFTNQLTAKGTPNPSYESMEGLMKMTSIAASDIDHADRVRIRRANISMNEYYNQNGALVSYPRIRASFVNKINGEFKPSATFTAEFLLQSFEPEMNREGEETGRYKVVGILPQYGGNVDIIPFYAANPGVIEGINQLWSVGDTVKAKGKLLFSSRTETRTIEPDFGEAYEESKTVSVSDFIITSGAAPLDEEMAISADDARAALAARKERLASNKAAAESAPSHTAPAPAAKKAVKAQKFDDIGF